MGLSKGVKKLVQGKVPNLGRYDDVAEFLSRDANLSESEVEDDNEASRVTLPQEVSSRGNLPAQQGRTFFTCDQTIKGNEDHKELCHPWMTS